jgi:CDP-glycerol glycerophosphotransferase
MSAEPLLSVVVPARNVELYLADCLNSIANQTYRNLEVIVVDDGSEDATPQIAADFAARDPRFRLISQAASGPGGARNTGIDAATGTYLAFVDGDDKIPSYAYSLAIACLERTGSDIVCGDVRRFTSRGMTGSPQHNKIFRTTTLRTHISQHTLLVRDRTVWNKVYRRRFWDEHGFRFPEGVVFEDVPVALSSHVMATSVDVLSVPVYYWRRREAGSASITQRKTEWSLVADRFKAVDKVSRFLAEHRQRALKNHYDANALVDDLQMVLMALPNADDDFRAAFLDAANDFLERVDPKVLSGLPAKFRVQWHLVRRRMMPELVDVVLATRPGVPTPTIVRGLRRYAELPYFDDPKVGVPRELYRLPDPPLRSTVHDISWRDGRLWIRGHVFVDGISSARPWSSGRLMWLSETKTRRRVPVSIRPKRCPDATAESKHEDCSYHWSGFEASIDPTALQQDGKWVDGTWAVVVGILGLPRPRKDELKPTSQVLSLPSQYVADNVRVVPVFDGKRLRLKVETVRARVTSCAMSGENLEITGEVRGPAPVAGRLRFSRVPDVPDQWVPVEFGEKSKAWTPFRTVVPLQLLVPDRKEQEVLEPGAAMHRWRIEIALYSGGKQARHLITDVDLSDARTRFRGHDVYVRCDGEGCLWLCARPAAPVVTEMAWTDDGKLVLTGDLGSRLHEIVLRLRGTGERSTIKPTVDGDNWQAVLAPRALPLFGGTVELRPGEWDLLCQVDTVDGPVLTNLVVADAVLRRMPLTKDINGRDFAILDTNNDGAKLQAGPLLRDDERGAFNRKRLHVKYHALRRAPRRDAILFESFGGRQYSDSPRAVHEELIARGVGPAEHLWVVRDGQVSVPPTARAILRGGAEYYEALASCRYIVTNNHLPDWFERAPDQVVAQLWHGTPLKRIGFDTELRFADLQYLSRLEKEVPNWSFLVSPNRFSTPILKRAFRYNGEVIEVGYPRNDVLFHAREEVAAQVRERLDLPAGKKVVLYAPTWRDDEFYGMGRYKLSLHLDLEDAHRRLGDDHVLLIRRHPNVVDAIPPVEGFVWDVSRYPDVADLLALADILVTDYSSLMFDFANTGRPMLFFTYDLEHYRDRLRGFYFDFEREAPGPLLNTSSEVVEAIRHVDEYVERYREQYEAFVARFCDLDDGKATSRVIDRLFR